MPEIIIAANATDDLLLAPALTSQICGIGIIILSLLGLIPYMVVVLIVFTKKKLKKSFYRLAGSLGVADCVCLVLMIGFAGPCTILQQNLSDSKIIGGILNVGWFSGLPLIVVQATDRFFCICHKDFYIKFYTLRNANYACIACWVFGTAYSLPSFFDCCPIYFDYVLITWGWDFNKVGSIALSHGELTMVIIALTITYVLNGLVIRKVRKMQRTIGSLGTAHDAQKTIREKRLFIQFLITTIWLIIFDAPFLAIGYVPNPSYSLGYFVTLAYTINCSINGWVYILMNAVIRKEIKLVVRKKKCEEVTEMHLSRIKEPTPKFLGHRKMSVYTDCV